MKRVELEAQLRALIHHILVRELEFDQLVGYSTNSLAPTGGKFALGVASPAPSSEEIDRLLEAGQKPEPGRSIKQTLRDHFRAFPHVDFSVAEVMRSLHLGESQADAVRKTLQRL